MLADSEGRLRFPPSSDLPLPSLRLPASQARSMAPLHCKAAAWLPHSRDPRTARIEKNNNVSNRGFAGTAGVAIPGLRAAAPVRYT